MRDTESADRFCTEAAGHAELIPLCPRGKGNRLLTGKEGGAVLQLLHIENIAVIEQADIELNDGLTVLTGETGAGKSIIIDSIGAVMGSAPAVS